jgi:N-acetylneuraminic acid mutarotase
MIFDLLVSDEWSKIDQTHLSARAWHSAIVYNQNLFVFGGKSSNGLLDDLHSLQLDTMTWKSITTEGLGPSPRYAHTMCVFSNLLIVAGGIDDNGPLNDIHVLDIGLLLLILILILICFVSIPFKLIDFDFGFLGLKREK